MQFYIDTTPNDLDLIDTLTNLLGMEIETLEHPNDQAAAFLMQMFYEAGFPLGINISWKPGLTPKTDRLEIARELAKHYNTQVATDLPETNSSVQDPYYWCVAEPTGTLFKVAQKVSEAETDETDGLVLDLMSKEILSTPR